VSVHRYRVVAEMYAPSDQMTGARIESLEVDLRLLVLAYCPLGVVEGYPDILDMTEIAERHEMPLA